jgi:hypothetical protein
VIGRGAEIARLAAAAGVEESPHPFEKFRRLGHVRDQSSTARNVIVMSVRLQEAKPQPTMTVGTGR